jgi:Ca2+-binding EF-hand superfamily protein
LSIKGYARFFRVLSFFQAVSVTSLILSHLSAPVSGRLEIIAYVLAWIECPVFLTVIVPTIIRRLTLLRVIKQSKDDGVSAKVIMQGKENLLRDFVRLIQLVGFERRASMEGGLTADGLQYGRRSEIQLVLQGLKKFERMSEDEQREISLLFAAWDGHGIGVMETREMVEAFSTMGVADPQAAVKNLIRVLDFDSTGKLSWMKFKALFGLAIGDVPTEDKHLDLSLTYEMLDTDHDGELTIFELSDGFERMHIGIGLDDMANLLFVHFGIAKPFITRAEFVQWMVAVSEELQ